MEDAGVVADPGGVGAELGEPERLVHRLAADIGIHLASEHLQPDDRIDGAIYW